MASDSFIFFSGKYDVFIPYQKLEHEKGMKKGNLSISEAGKYDDFMPLLSNGQVGSLMYKHELVSNRASLPRGFYNLE